MTTDTKQQPPVLYDLIIVGGGPAGLNAALYAQRKGLKTLIVAGQFGGQMQNTSTVENYLGIKTADGYEISQMFADHVRELGPEMKEYVEVTDYETLADGRHKITLSDRSEAIGRAMIIATGTLSRRLGVPGEDTYDGRGVSYCAICDGPLYRDRKVVISGGGNSAVEGAMDIARVTDDVTIVQRSILSADQVLQEQMAKQANVKVLLQTEIREILGDGDAVTGVKVYDKVHEETSVIPCDGLFIEIGVIPNLGPFDGHVTVNDYGEIVIDEDNMTNVPGLFAAGDVTEVKYKQITVASAEGAAAALSATSYLNQGRA